MKLLSKILTLFLAMTLTVTGCGNASGSNQDTGNSKAKTVNQEASGEKTDGETEVVKLGIVTGSTTHFLAIVEKHKGFYKKNGIDLKSTEFAMGINAIDAMATGQVDLTHVAEYAGINRIGNTKDDTDLRFLTQFGRSDDYELYVNPKKIKNAKDLKGQTVATIAGSVYDYWYARLYDYAGLSAKDVKSAPVSSVQEALALADNDGAVAFWATTKQQKGMFADKGWEALITNGEIDADCIQALIATEDFAVNRKDVAAKFLKATDEAIQYINDNVDEVAEWINTDIGIDKETFSGILESDYTLGFTKDVYDKMQTVNEWCRKNGNYDAEFDVKDFISTDALEVYNPDLDLLK